MPVTRLRRFMAEDSGQNLVEFALLLPILMYILMGIMQFGLIFAAYITVNNAVREGARWGSIYVYDSSSSQTQATNDTARQNGILERLVAGRGILNIPAVGSSTNNFNAGTTSTWTSTAVADCFNQSPVPNSAAFRGDVTICYTIPTGVTSNDARRGYYMEVTGWYHQQIFMPLLDTFLPDDTSKGAQQTQWLRLPGRVTVVIN